MHSVYIVDDEKMVIDSVVRTISWLEHGFEVIGLNTDPVLAACEIISMKPDLVICDLKMPRLDGIALIKSLKEANVGCEFIMLSAFGEFEASRSFFLLEGFDYLLKPLDPMEAEIVLEKLARKLAQKDNQTPSTALLPTGTKAFDDLVVYIIAHYNQKHTLKSLSQRFNLSANYICSLFSKHYNSTLTMLLTNIRMHEASKMISNSDAPMKEIAIECGYPDYFYFCRMFKMHFGVPPTEYKQLLQGTQI